MESIKRTFLLALLFMVCVVVQAQSLQVSGTVVSKSDGEPVIGATILEQGTTNGTITDFDGKFSLTVKQGAEISISYIGFKSQVVKAQTVLNIVLAEDTEVLDEVVVTGYMTEKKASLTGSVAVVKMKDVADVPTGNVMSALLGRVAGMNVTTDGTPGGMNTGALVRGSTTINNSAPLYVIDGVQTRDNIASILSSNDVESIQVLKDAASAAIYGARAANGVILVTTKRGKEGKMQVNYNGSYTLSQPTRIPQMLNSYQYATYVNEYDADPRHDQGGITYSDEVLQHYINHDDDLNYPDTDWWDAVAKDWAGKTQHSLSVSGGNDKLSFYSSAQYMWQDAIYKQSTQDYKQYQFITNIDAKINKSVRFSFDILGRQEHRTRGI